MSPNSSLLKRYFTARRGQDQAVIRYAGGEIDKVVTLAAPAVTTADREDVA